MYYDVKWRAMEGPPETELARLPYTTAKATRQQDTAAFLASLATANPEGAALYLSLLLTSTLQDHIYY
jgi:hypothetical protein